LKSTAIDPVDILANPKSQIIPNYLFFKSWVKKKKKKRKKEKT